MQKGVNTLFVELVEHILAEKPANPIQFIVEYLSSHYPDMTRPLLVTGFDPDSDSEPEDHDVDESKDDERDELRTFTHKSKQRRRAVSAPCLTSDPDRMAPVVRGPHKSDADKHVLGEILRTSPLFGALTSAEVALLVDAARPDVAATGDTIIAQGEEGDRVFALVEGQVRVVQRRDKGVDRVVVVKAGNCFGELGVMYEGPRPAAVEALRDCKMWYLDRLTVKNALVAHTVAIRARSAAFLAAVPILGVLTETERLHLADALKVQEFTAGDVVLRQNDPGEVFYIIESGIVSVTQQASPVSPPVELCRLSTGEFVGEWALLSNRPRQASVIAVTESVVTLTVSRETFRRLLGPLPDLLKRDQRAYNAFMAQKI